MTSTATKSAVVTPLDFGRRHPVKPVFPVRPVAAFEAKRQAEIAKSRSNHPAGKSLPTGA